MKEAFLLLLFFIPCLKSQSIQELKINPDKTTNLPLAFSPIYNYFYIKASSSSSSTLIIRLNSSGYIFDTPQYCYSSENPTQNFSDYQYKGLPNYRSYQNKGVKDLNCTLSVKDNNYIVVRYSGNGTNGWLHATCYYKKGLSTTEIIFIVVGAIIVVVVVIIAFYCVCKKRVGGGVNSPSTQAAFGASNASLPLMGQNYTNNPNYTNYTNY